MDLAMALAAAKGADIVVANDPDADRCAVAVPGPHGWRMLRGDEVGALLGHHLLRRGKHGTYANSIVSSSLLAKMAAAAGQPHEETLTGFKWIGRVEGLAFGYEEALGYCVDPEHVRDKDGVSALLLVCELAAAAKAEGRGLTDLLDDIALEHGLHATDQLSVRFDDLSEIPATMERLRTDPAHDARRARRRARRRPLAGQRRPAAHRRAALLPGRRRPGDRAPERHRAQGQVLPRGRRPGRPRGRRGRRPHRRGRPARRDPRPTSRPRPASEPEPYTNSDDHEGQRGDDGQADRHARPARRRTSAASASCSSERARRPPRREPPPSAGGAVARRSPRRAGRGGRRVLDGRCCRSGRRAHRLAQRPPDDRGDVALLPHPDASTCRTASCSIAARGTWTSRACCACTRCSVVAHDAGRSIEAQASTAASAAPADHRERHRARVDRPARPPRHRRGRATSTAVTRPLVGSNRSTGCSCVHAPSRGPRGLSARPSPTLCWVGDDHFCLNGECRGLRRHHLVRVLPAPLPPRPPRGRPGRRGGPRRQPGHPVDQDDRQGVRDRPRHPHGRPDHARGPGHPRQGPRAGLQGHAPRPGRPDLPRRRRGLRLPRHGRDRQADAGRLRRQRRRRRHGLPQRPRRPRHQARRHPRRRRGRCRRDRHGHRPGRVPLRALPAGVRRDRRRPRGVRTTRTSRSSSRPASCRPTTTSAAPRGSR